VLSNGQPEKAWAVIAKLHADPNDPSGEFAREEFHQMSEQIARDNLTYGNVTILDMFRKPQFRKRMIAAALVMASSQLTGNLVIYSTFPPPSSLSSRIQADTHAKINRQHCNPVQGPRPERRPLPHRLGFVHHLGVCLQLHQRLFPRSLRPRSLDVYVSTHYSERPVTHPLINIIQNDSNRLLLRRLHNRNRSRPRRNLRRNEPPSRPRRHSSDALRLHHHVRKPPTTQLPSPPEIVC
jgi:hypothetical protein